MKLLLFSDIHESRQHCENIVKLSREADIVVGAGDFGSLRKGIKETVEFLKVIKKPVVVVPGNSESFEELQEACSDWASACVLHGSGVTIEGIPFYGIGGGIPVTPFGSWSYDFTEDQARDMLKDCPEKAVLVSHSPPKGVVDVSSRGESLGSVAVKETIEQKSPRCVVCGHIHESSGKYDTLNDVPVFNAGPRGMWWELPSE